MEEELALLALCHLFSNKKEWHIVHIQVGSLRACTFALSYRSLNKQHDLYLIASLWVVATQVRSSLTIFQLSNVKSTLSESSLKCSFEFKALWRTLGHSGFVSFALIEVYYNTSSILSAFQLYTLSGSVLYFVYTRTRMHSIGSIYTSAFYVAAL